MMDSTNERHNINNKITKESEYYNHLMHIATYQYALQFVKNKKVLDYGCGLGYGSYILSSQAKSVIAVDISTEAINYAKSKYQKSNLIFTSTFDLTHDLYDVITTFQVLEHIRDAEIFITKLRNQLNPGGLLLLSTPDNKNRIFSCIQQPWNIYHFKEYSFNTLNNLLSKHFGNVRVIKIGSRSEIILNEIKRTRKERIITLPATLIIYPNSLRILLLRFEAIVFNWIKKLIIKKEPAIDTFNQYDSLKSRFSINDIEFSNSLQYNTDLFSISIKNECSA